MSSASIFRQVQTPQSDPDPAISPNMKSNRRHFLRSAATAGIASSLGPWVLRGGEGRSFRTALVGSGWWGMNVLAEAMASRRCPVTAICDVHEDALERTASKVRELSGDTPRRFRDFREMLERTKPEVVIVASPDHWHALHTIAALKAGAHVFVEKPTGHTVNESRAMLKTARETGRVVQVGLHRRIGPHHVSGMKFLKEGRAGQIGMIRLFAFSGGGRELPTPNGDVPEGLDWDLYCGPAPLRPYNSKIHPGGFRNFLDFANGTLGDWGVHWLDQVLWWTEERYPRRIFCSGGRPVKGKPILTPREQTTDAPDSLVATYEFSNFTVVWEHRQFAENNAEKHKIGAYFYGTKGTLHLGWRDGWTFYPSSSREAVVHEDAHLQEPDGHNLTLLWADFMDSIDRHRNPVSDIEAAHRSSVLPLLGMISWRLGRSIEWDGSSEQVVSDPEGNRLLSRPYRAPWIYPA